MPEGTGIASLTWKSVARTFRPVSDFSGRATYARGAYLFMEAFQLFAISGYPVVAKVPSQFLHQRLPLFPHPEVPIFLHPLTDCLQTPAYPLSRRLATDREASLSGLPPVVGEPQKVECARFCWLLLPFRGRANGISLVFSGCNLHPLRTQNP